MAAVSKEVRRESLWQNWGPAASALLTILVLGLVLVTLLSRYEHDVLSKSRSEIENLLEPHCNALSLAIVNRLSLLHGLRAYVESELKEPNLEIGGEFPTFAAILHGGVEGVRALSIAPGGVQTYIYPIVGNEKIIGVNLLTDQRPGVRESVERAVATKSIVVAGPYKLITGDLGFVGRIAIFKGDAFWGLVSSSVEVPSLLKSSGFEVLSRLISLAIRREGGEVFFGPASVFEGDPIVERIDVADQYWEVGAQPVGGWGATVRARLAPAQAAGVLIILLASSLAYLLAGRHAGLAKAVKARTEELALSNERFRESEKRLAIILDAIGEGVIATDGAGRIVRMNPAAERLTGWPLTEATDLTPQTLLGPRVEHGEAPLVDVLQSRSAAEIQQVSTLFTKEGAERTVWYSVSPLPGETGEVSGAVLVLRDITSEHEARAALRRSEKLFRTLVQASPLAIISLTPEGEVTSWNEAAEKMYGWRSDEVIGGPLPAIPLDFRDQCAAIRQRVAFGEAFHNFETVWSRKDGSLMDVSLSAAPFQNDAGEMEGFITISADITVHKRAEEALRASEERFQLAMRGANDGLWDWDLGTDAVYYSPRWKSMLGYAEAELENHLETWKRLAHPDDRESTLAAVRDFVEERADKFEVEFRMMHKDGHYLDVLSRAFLLRNSRGEAGRLVGTHVDITERKRAEEALSDREAKLRTIFGATSVGIGMAVDRVIQEANDALCRITGYSREELLARDARFLYASEEAYALVGEEIQRQIAARGTTTLETRWRGKDGAIREIVLGTTQIDATDHAKGRIFTALDITERKQAEQALRESEYFLRKSQEVARLGSYCFDTRTGRWIGSGTLDEIAGIDESYPKTVEGWIDFIHPDHKKEMLRYLTEHVIGQRSAFDKEYRIIRRNDGQERWVHGIGELELDEDGQPIKLIGTTQDITERKRAEEALRKSRRLLDASQRLTHLGSWEMNLATGEAACSDEIFRILGLKPQEIQPTIQGFINRIHPDDRELVSNHYREIQETGKFESYDYRLVKPDGTVQWIHATGEIDLDNEGSPVGVVGTLQDITEKRLAQEEKEKLESQLVQAQKMESIGRLAGGVAHDFNNMLSVIFGYAELIKSDMSLDDPMLSYILEIEKAAAHSRDITRQLLAFSRKQIIAPRPINLNDHFTETQKTLSRMIEEDIHLQFAPGKDLWTIKLDPSQLDQILINLAVNARDAMPDGGRLTIQTSNVSIDSEYISKHYFFTPGEYVLLEMTDEGAGMDQETLSRIFEPFFTTKELGRGTGLGLATVYGIVKQNNCFINVYSEPGQGTTFKVYFPRAAAEEITKKTGEAPIASVSGTVLLVEDSEPVRRLVADLLEAVGYTVLAAETPFEALSLCEKEGAPIDLLLTDVVMPGMSGAELRDKIAAIRPEIKVLFMSGYTENVIAHRGVLKEGVHFIQKPFSMRDIAAKIHQVTCGQ